MTDKEKARAYDEAIERAQEAADSGMVSQNFVDDIFQLRESEDERIRKELVNFILYKAGHLLDKDTEHRFIDWLEKQKEKSEKPIIPEKKPAEWSEEDERMFSRCVKSIESSKQFADSDTFKKAKDNEIDWLENRFKFLCPQPKVEWSEEDEKMVRFYEADYNNQIGDMLMNDVIDMRLEFKNWLANRLKSLRPQPHLSKEEFIKFGNLEYERGIADGYKKATEEYNKHTSYHFPTPCYTPPCYEGGPCTNPQMDCINCPRRTTGGFTTSPNTITTTRTQWKPSEQEKGALRTAIYILTDERNFPKTAAQLQNILDAFEEEEPRKDWKPSEEHFQGLRRAITKAEKGSDAWNSLTDLYEQLKKLI